MLTVATMMRRNMEQIQNIPDHLPQQHIEEWKQDDWDVLERNIFRIGKNLRRRDATSMAVDNPNPETTVGINMHVPELDFIVRFMKVQRALCPLRQSIVQILSSTDDSLHIIDGALLQQFM